MADVDTAVTWAVNAVSPAPAQLIVNGTTGWMARSTGTKTATLAVGENFIKVRVTAPDGEYSGGLRHQGDPEARTCLAVTPPCRR